MLQSQLFGKTLREAPSGAESQNQILLTRGGFIKQMMSGVYSLLPLGFRVFKNIENVIREELAAVGAQEVSMPIIHPAEIWKKTGRFHEIGRELWRIKNRENQDFVLAMTHEEAIAETAAHYISSGTDLPLLLNQFQVKIRDEERPRGGLLRLREFVMQDAYSFDKNEKDLDQTYKKIIEAYEKIFKRLEVKIIPVKADSGIMGGSESHEFMALSLAGEDELNGKKAIELGHTFKLGYKYSKPFNIYFEEKGQKKLAIMGSYGIGLDRLIAAIVETSHDNRGIVWPKAASPFRAHLVTLGKTGDRVKKASDKIYNGLIKQGINILYDDRDQMSVGEKFADADLIGICLRIVVSAKTLEKASMELKSRKEEKTSLMKIRDLSKVSLKL
ncbi:hypothetical protein A2608_03530 [Candidatus Azambacteria bacterium RIFOXYD1_FULL_44_10]|uniref:Proline--tRNA ligase n=1 Tax=Candidatus Azambacteria bacterium RIFCSPLOWO2_02_FULL_44_14 TaxID=1797306 RepID=A0A1F5CBU8_9BACT|nr:MAG: hypothetical protein A3C78_03065 [Candidatus Azambacteria bacterium RIFCSPHIGHO2_02_FULL_45_18]OGD40317.1 MAG: hypothetical protein A3I30_03425 [Candidatus Azambacteria bacterium RIFCSPLOWO2_02_FULL_44_14]OGD50397.1 MAG: hypothetical protein A2608_03530 [Candidatus Azambacteria bacterium RIFOXYD1_FULL_44_10]